MAISWEIVMIVMILLIIIFIIVYDDIDAIYYYLSCDTSTDTAGIPTSNNNKKIIIRSLEKFIDPNYIFIDFGCGNGDILDAFKYKFRKLIGIEIDKNIANRAKFLLKKYRKIKIINDDIQNYKFTNKPTVLYMYEPLWKVYPMKKAHKIYSKVIRNVSKIKKQVYIIYLSGYHRKDLSQNFFYKRGFHIIKHKILDFFPHRDFYIYEKNSE